MKSREVRPPSPWRWLGASLALLAGLGFARWWLERPAPQRDRITLDDASWVTALHPTLVAHCGPCHADPSRALLLRPASSAAEGIDALARARAMVIPGDAAGSALRRRALGERHPRSMEPGGCVDLAITAWIEGRAVRRCEARGGFTLPRGLTPLGHTRDAGALDLSTPARALATQVELLRRMDYDALRGAFATTAQLGLTDRALDECRLAVIARGAEAVFDEARVELREGGTVARVPTQRPGLAAAELRREGDRWITHDLWCGRGAAPPEGAGRRP